MPSQLLVLCVSEWLSAPQWFYRVLPWVVDCKWAKPLCVLWEGRRGLFHSLFVSSVTNSEVIPSKGPVFVQSGMMSPVANQHVALLEVVCVCVWAKGRWQRWRSVEERTTGKITLAEYLSIWFSQQAWKNTDSQASIWLTWSCDV